MNDESVIKISNVWKIFGANAKAALQAIRERGLGKAEVLAEYNAVVGVADVSLSVDRGEIFCVMGLSGSGKSTLVRHFNRLLAVPGGRNSPMSCRAGCSNGLASPGHWLRTPMSC